MISRVTLRDHLRETQLFSSRIIAALLVILLCALILVVRLIYLQVVDYEHYKTLSKNNRVNLVAVPPTRGLIFDRNGVVLAENLPSFTLEIVVEKIVDLDATLNKLKEIITITAEDIAQFDKLRQRSASFKAIPLRYQLSQQEVARFSVRQHQFSGVDVHARLLRYYPLGELAVHAIGYVGRINESEQQVLDQSNYSATSHIGKTGVEKYYEAVLHGQVGVREVETNAQGRILRVLSEIAPVPGKNLYLNLDINVQAVAEAALAGQRGAIVAINPKSGGLIALVSLPGYDPNLFVNGITSKLYQQLSTSLDKPLFNRAIKGQYPPGSTVKPLIALAGLELNVVHEHKSIFCPGWYRLKNRSHKYRDWKRGGHGNMDMEDAIAESCDVYFYDLAQNLGIDRMSSYLALFGLGSRTGIDILGEASGLMPTRAWKRRVKKEVWYPGETLITGIGQGFALTSPLQLAVATAALVNNGLFLAPRVVATTQDQLSNEVEPLTSNVKQGSQIASKRHWGRVIAMMEEVVHGPRGSARSIGKNAPYRMAGKTGTAQVFGIKQDERYVKEEVAQRLRDHALFIAFAPVEDPQIVVAVIVENGGSGGSMAAPIARQVMDQYLLQKVLPYN